MNFWLSDPSLKSCLTTVYVIILLLNKWQFQRNGGSYERSDESLNN